MEGQNDGQAENRINPSTSFAESTKSSLMACFRVLNDYSKHKHTTKRQQL